MGLEVSRIFALAEGSFHIRNTKKATLGTSSKMSQKRTLRQRDDSQDDNTGLSEHVKTSHWAETITWSLQCPHTEPADICEAW